MLARSPPCEPRVDSHKVDTVFSGREADGAGPGEDGELPPSSCRAASEAPTVWVGKYMNGKITVWITW